MSSVVSVTSSNQLRLMSVLESKERISDSLVSLFERVLAGNSGEKANREMRQLVSRLEDPSLVEKIWDVVCRAFGLTSNIKELFQEKFGRSLDTEIADVRARHAAEQQLERLKGERLKTLPGARTQIDRDLRRGGCVVGDQESAVRGIPEGQAVVIFENDFQNYLTGKGITMTDPLLHNVMVAMQQGVGVEPILRFAEENPGLVPEETRERIKVSVKVETDASGAQVIRVHLQKLMKVVSIVDGRVGDAEGVGRFQIDVVTTFRPDGTPISYEDRSTSDVAARAHAQEELDKLKGKGLTDLSRAKAQIGVDLSRESECFVGSRKIETVEKPEDEVAGIFEEAFQAYLRENGMTMSPTLHYHVLLAMQQGVAVEAYRRFVQEHPDCMLMERDTSAMKISVKIEADASGAQIVRVEFKKQLKIFPQDARGRIVGAEQGIYQMHVVSTFDAQGNPLSHEDRSVKLLD